MRRHAKASSAGPTKGNGSSRGLFPRAFAFRGASGDVKGSGARRGGRLGTILTAFTMMALALGLTAGNAAAAAPVTSIESVSAVSYASVHLKGKITMTPSPEFTYWDFETSTDGVNWNGFAFGHSFPPGTAGEKEIEADLTNLKGGTKYFVRLHATNFIDPDGISPPPNPEFTTLPVDPPSVLSTDNATNVRATKANVSGVIERPNTNANPAFDVSWRFEYVTDAQFTATGFENALRLPYEVEKVKTTGPTPVSTELTELTPSTKYHFRLVAENAGGSPSLEAASTFTTLAGSAPAGIIDSLDASAYSIAVVSHVNPNGVPTEAFFEYSSDGGASWVPFPPNCCGGTIPTSLGEGNSPVEYSKTITGLLPNKNYLVRVHGLNAVGDNPSPSQGVKTDSPPPKTQTLDAGPVGSTTATLAGQINPGDSPVTYQFQWGVQQGANDTTYENVAPATPQVLLAEDNSFHGISAPLTGLAPETSYHFRLVATNEQTSAVETGADKAFKTGAAVSPPPAACPNESSRLGASAGLPDCRAFEWVTPELNNVFGETNKGVEATADGSAIRFNTPDVPLNAEGGMINTWTVARKGPSAWSTKSLAPRVIDPPLQAFRAAEGTNAVSRDMTEAVVYSTQPLAGNRPSGDMNAYLRRADGSYTALSTVGQPTPAELQWDMNFTENIQASADFKHIYFGMPQKQLPEDPINRGNLYEWFNGKLSLVGLIPGTQTLMPEGAGPVFAANGSLLPSVSNSGNALLFMGYNQPGLFLRVNSSETVEVTKSQRTPEDTNPVSTIECRGSQPSDTCVIGVTEDGSEALFFSRRALTNDANTGKTGGALNDRGTDIYSYDVASKKLTDLTVDTNPDDVETGADVRRVPAASADGSYIYFVATGNLAPGAASGEQNLYVEHEGEIDFVGPANNLDRVSVNKSGAYAAITSSDQLTGYNNAGKNEIYKYTYRGSMVCVSCRPNGTPPSGNALTKGRAINASGSRVFFESTDSIVPGVPGGVPRVYEYTNGSASLLTPAELTVPSHILDASESGDDVFINTDAELVPGVGTNFAIYDARVNADVARIVPAECSGEACLGAPTSAPKVPSVGTSTFDAPVRVAGPTSISVNSQRVSLRVVVPGGGKLSLSGKGLKSLKKNASKAGPVTFTVTLTPGANKRRLSKGKFKTKARVQFTSSAGETSVTEVALNFHGTKKKGGK